MNYIVVDFEAACEIRSYGITLVIDSFVEVVLTY